MVRRMIAFLSPRFTVWEVVVMVFVVIAGINGLLIAGPSSSAQVLLGPAVFVFYVLLICSGTIALIGSLIHPPDGLVIQLGGHVLLGVTCSAIYAGTAFMSGTPLYAGSVAILIFTVGAMARSWQIISQLRELRISITKQVEK
jgi:hypothetical protein